VSGSFSTRDWIARLTDELAGVVGALLETAATVTPADRAPAGGWAVTLRGGNGAQGSLIVHFEGDAARAFSRRLMGLDADPDDLAVVDTLKEVCSQAASAVIQQPPLAGVTLSVEDVAAEDTAGADSTVASIALTDGESILIAFRGDLEIPAARVSGPETDSALNPALDVILDIDLPLLVRFGRTELPLRSLAAIGPGSVIDLGRSPDDPVEVLVSNHVVARGEVVIVAGNYGVRIRDVVSPAERARSLEVELT
jgi:flagellar motor switch protein FliN/FliY